MNKIRILILTFLTVFAFAINAQVTTSGITGSIIDTESEPVIGATVLAVHEPSGTQYGTVTNVDGRFTLQGMRTGGPYKVTISYVGYNTAVFTDINLQLGEVFSLNAKMNQSSELLSEIIVVGTASKFATEKTGASTNISNEKMTTMPTISRSISDIARMSPYANGMSFAGGDGRSSNFTVDGANLNNNFGLSNSLPGGGNPISLDAIEEVQVVVAPFDVRQTNFIGGGVNAITKSGTNTFKGTAYTYQTNQNMRGNKIGDYDFGERPKESNSIYGFTFGGPILKNKLFFFANLEYEQSPQQVIDWRASTDGVGNADAGISRVTEADLQKVSDHLKSKYGYNTGSFKDFPAKETNLKYLIRIDWNINDDHKLSVRFNHTKNMAWNPPNGNSTDGHYRDRDKNRVSYYSMSYANSMYSMDNIVNSATMELNSRFTNNISNQLLFTFSDMRDMRGSTSDPFPFIDIMSGDIDTGAEALAPYISAGYELFTFNNGVKNRVVTLTDNFTYYLDKHKITAGLSYEYQMADNNYMRNGTAYYRYASISDFINGAAPVDFALTYGTNGNLVPSNAVTFSQIGLYAQDEWNIKRNVKITYGLRADYLVFADNILTNNAIKEIDFDGRHIDTGQWPTAKINFSPRIGVNWDVMDDKSLVVRGGTGLFTGRLPLVFFTNMPSNAGMNQMLMKLQTQFNADGSVKTRDAALDKLAGGMITDVDALIKLLGFQTTVTPDDGSVPSSVAGVDKDFKMPQVWKTSLAVDYKLPVSFPFSVTVEAMFTKNINAVMIDNYLIKKPEASWEKFAGADNRYIYPSNYKTTTNTVVRDASVLTNTNKGYGYTFNITLNAEPVKNLDLMAAYTYTEMKELSSMPGSNANSAWIGVYSVNGPNVPDVQRSQYVMPHRIIASAAYRIPYLRNHMATTVSIFYTGYSPYGNTFSYSNDMNGDGVTTDLIYIPKNKGDIKFVSQADEDAFFKFIDQDNYLRRHKGEYAQPYAARAPMVHKFDLRFVQDFSVQAGNTRNTLQVSLDFLNFGNLLNSNWGVNKTMTPSNNGRILKYEGKDAQNVPSYSMVKVKDDSGVDVYPTQTYTPYLNRSQCWSLQLGIRYIFN